MFADVELRNGEITAAVKSKSDLKNGKWISTEFTVQRFDKAGKLLDTQRVENLEFSELELVDDNRVKIDQRIISVK